MAEPVRSTVFFLSARMDDDFGLRTWQEDDGFVGVLSEPFPLREEWNDISSQPSAELADRDESEHWKQMDMFHSNYWRSSLVNGAIPIFHEGCALRIWLVLTGTQAGYLWEDRRAEYAGLKPLRLVDGSSATFAGWYEAWLIDCLNSGRKDQQGGCPIHKPTAAPSPTSGMSQRQHHADGRVAHI